MAKPNGGIATARSCSNIAFIKYWGNRDDGLRIASNGSISMNLAGLETVTTVRFAGDIPADSLVLNGTLQNAPMTDRVSKHLDYIRSMVGMRQRAEITSTNNFPLGTGIASSASAFAALTAAGCAAAGLNLTEKQMSTIARLGSGSASRSIPSGYVEWYAGLDHDGSYAATIAAPEHWPLVDLIAVVSQEHKSVGSTEGHRLAPTSPLQAGRLEDSTRRLDQCRDAILSRDFDALAIIIEEDALIMHAVMMTSRPALLYWQPATLAVMQLVRQWRAEGLGVAFTIDAGPNVHVLCEASHKADVASRLEQIDGVEKLLEAAPGGPTRLENVHLPR